MKLKSTDLLRDFIALLYPNLCLACSERVPIPKDIFCVQCYYRLPYTNFLIHKENLLTDRFWGRIEIEDASAIFYFTKGGIAQKLVHNLKYKGKTKIGLHLGESYGEKIKRSNSFKDVDVIIPVPLHYTKKRVRGFNQSELFANGLSKSLGIPVYAHTLLRSKNLSSQTIKSRLERLENVLGSFVLAERNTLENKHILLVDDVVTTGATLEACALKILELPNTKVSIVAIAIAK